MLTSQQHGGFGGVSPAIRSDFCMPCIAPCAACSTCRGGRGGGRGRNVDNFLGTPNTLCGILRVFADKGGFALAEEE